MAFLNLNLSKVVRLVSITTLSTCLIACSGSRPGQLGEVNTSLTPCPDKPNCVSSLAPTDSEHFIAPLSYGKHSDIKNAVLDIIKSGERTEVIVDSDLYIYAEYTSATMGFVDDVEFLFEDKNSLIQVRSASRLGYKDFDVNRERIEAIREKLEQ